MGRIQVFRRGDLPGWEQGTVTFYGRRGQSCRQSPSFGDAFGEIQFLESVERGDDELFSAMEERAERDGGQGSMLREELYELLL